MLMEKKINLSHIIVHICFQAVGGIVYGFAIYMLLQRGFSSSEAGIYMSVGCLLSMIIQIFLSNYLDQTKKKSVFDVFKINTFVLTILFIINLFLRNKTIFLALVFIGFLAVYSSIEPLVNSLSSLFIRNNMNIEFSKARAAGSLSYGTICALFGVLSEKFNVISVLIGGFIFSLLLTIVCYGLNGLVKKSGIDVLAKDKIQNVSYAAFFKNQKHYILLCLCLVGLFYGYTSIDNFTLSVVEKVGGNSKDMGVILGIKAGVEAIGIFGYSKLTKKFKVNDILIFASFALVGKMAVCYIATNIIHIYLAQLIQTISFALIIPGMIEYIGNNMNVAEINRGQAFFTMSISVGSIFSSLFSGILIDCYGVSVMELVAVIVGLVSAGVYTYLLKTK